MKRTGAVQGTSTGKQHQDLYRKLLLRRQLLLSAPAGAAYVPFCGDGDIAAEVYAGRTVYAADLDPARVAVTQGRVTGECIVGDCDAWPFPGCEATFIQQP